MYYFMAVIGVYITCLFLLWNTGRSQSLKEFSKPLFQHTVDSNANSVYTQIVRGGNVVKLKDISKMQPLFKNGFKNHNAKTNDQGRTYIEAHETCINGSCFHYSGTTNSSKNYFDTIKRNYVGSKTFYLTEIIMVRIYRNDLAKWTIKELKQWMHFLFYAGVEHVYLCDHFVYQNESLKSALSKYIAKGLLTYIEWPWNASKNDGNIMRHQKNCYSHVIRKYGMDSVWQMSIDMDEFPVSLKDTKRLFLARFLKQTLANVSQILMPNFLMLGQGDRSKTMTIERITRITNKIAIDLKKPLYRISAIRNPGIHIHEITYGSTITANNSEFRMLHYWGARLQNWGPDTNKTIEMTEEFNFVKDTIAPAIRRNLVEFGEYDAFSNVTGP